VPVSDITLMHIDINFMCCQHGCKMKKLTGILIILLLTGALVSCSDIGYAREHVQWGNNHLHQGEYDDAIREFTAAIADHEYAEAYNMRGLTYYYKEQYAYAMDDLDKAIEIDGELCAAWDNRGLVWKAMDNHERALSDFTRSIRLCAEIPNPWNNRGGLHAKHGDLYLALDDYRKAIQVDPEFISAWSNAGWAFFDLGDYESALEYWDQALALDPVYQDALDGMQELENIKSRP